MNYQILKTLIDSLIWNFVCPNCNWKVSENNLEVVWAAWNSINLDVLCPACDKHTFVKAEMSQINLWSVMNLNKENLEGLKNKLNEIKDNLLQVNIKKEDFSQRKNIEAKINEKEILELREILKKEHTNVWDILGQD